MFSFFLFTGLTFIDPSHHCEFKIFSFFRGRVEPKHNSCAFGLEFKHWEHIYFIQCRFTECLMQKGFYKAVVGSWKKIKNCKKIKGFGKVDDYYILVNSHIPIPPILEKLLGFVYMCRITLCAQRNITDLYQIPAIDGEYQLGPSQITNPSRPAPQYLLSCSSATRSLQAHHAISEPFTGELCQGLTLTLQNMCSANELRHFPETGPVLFLPG